MIAIPILLVVLFSYASIYCSKNFTISYDGWGSGIVFFRFMAAGTLIYTLFALGHYFGWN